MAGTSFDHKTEMCTHINAPRGCDYGKKCKYAHSANELRPKQCRYEWQYGVGKCNFGNDCDNAKYHKGDYNYCWFEDQYGVGKCNHGNDCKNAQYHKGVYGEQCWREVRFGEGKCDKGLECWFAEYHKGKYGANKIASQNNKQTEQAPKAAVTQDIKQPSSPASVKSTGSDWSEPDPENGELPPLMGPVKLVEQVPKAAVEQAPKAVIEQAPKAVPIVQHVSVQPAPVIEDVKSQLEKQLAEAQAKNREYEMQIVTLKANIDVLNVLLSDKQKQCDGQTKQLETLHARMLSNFAAQAQSIPLIQAAGFGTATQGLTMYSAGPQMLQNKVNGQNDHLVYHQLNQAANGFSGGY